MIEVWADNSSFEKVIPSEDFPFGQEPKKERNFRPEVL
jgi:hypothetical protein